MPLCGDIAGGIVYPIIHDLFYSLTIVTAFTLSSLVICCIKIVWRSLKVREEKYVKMNERQGSSSWKNYLVIALCGLTIIPMLVMGLYCRPLADDYGACLQTRPALENGGVIQLLKAATEHVRLFYHTWQGVYTSEFLFSLHPGLFHEKFYIVTPLIFTTIPLVLIYFSICIINKHIMKESKSFCFMLASILTAFYLLWMPHPNEGLYWYSGAVNYLPWFFLSIYTICLLLDIFMNDQKHFDISKCKIAAHITGSCICCFLISGAHLSIAFENVLIMLLTEAYFIYRKKFYIGIFPLITSLIFFYINISAPGTAIRRGYFTGQPLIKSIGMTLQRFYYNIISYTTLHVIVLIIVFTPFALKIADEIKIKISFKHILISLATCSMIWCGIIIMPFYSMSNWGEGRYLNLVWTNYIFFLLLNYTLLWIKLTQKGVLSSIVNGMRTAFNKNCVWIMCIGVLGIFALPKPEAFDKINGLVNEAGYSNGIKAVMELQNGSAAQYAKELDERIELYNDDEAEEIVVNYLTTKPYLLYFSDLTSDPGIFPNTSIIRYYGKKSVVAH